MKLKIKPKNKMKIKYWLGLLSMCLIFEIGCCPITLSNSTRKGLFDKLDTKAKVVEQTIHADLWTNEYIAPNAVFECYVKMREPDAFEPQAVYINSKLPKSKIKQFKQYLEAAGYSSIDADLYCRLFSEIGNIIYKEDVFRRSQKEIEGILKHERTHYLVDRLSKKEKKTLHKAWEALRSKQDGNFIKARTDNVFITNQAQNAVLTFILWTREQEFLPYLVQGLVAECVIDTLRCRFPDAYQIYERIKHEVEHGINTRQTMQEILQKDTPLETNDGINKQDTSY